MKRIKQRTRLAVVLWATIVILTLTAFQEGTPTPVPAPVVALPQGYELVWADEFDGAELDLTQWEHRYPGADRGGSVNDVSTVTLSGDGTLTITARVDATGQLLGGMIQSQETFVYGYFEVRLRFQRLQGQHGAFWLQSPRYAQSYDPGVTGAEIDIIEYFGGGRPTDDAQQNVYWHPYSGAQPCCQHRIGYEAEHGEALSADFHTYAVLWTDAGYVFYIDGVETWRMAEGLSHAPEQIVLSLESANWEHERLDVVQLPDGIEVDYVRVYRAD